MISCKFVYIHLHSFTICIHLPLVEYQFMEHPQIKWMMTGGTPILEMVYTIYKNCDDWGMVYGIALPNCPLLTTIAH